MTNEMETAFDMFSATAEASKAGGDKALLMEAFTLTHAWLKNVPPALLPDIIERLKLADRAKQTSTDPLAGLAAFFGAPQANGHAPIAALPMSGPIDSAIAAPVVEPTPSLSPEHQLMLDSLEGMSPDMTRRWADWARRSTRLDGDQSDGFTHMMENVLDGHVRITSIGEPLANEGVRTRDKQIRDLERSAQELNDKIGRLTAERDKLKTDLDNAKSAATSTPAPASNQLMMSALDAISAINALHRIDPVRLDASNPVQVATYLSNNFLTNVKRAVDQEINNRSALEQRATNAEADRDLAKAKAAADAEAKVAPLVKAAAEARSLMRSNMRAVNRGSKMKPNLAIEGGLEVDTKLREITGPMSEFGES